MFNAMQILKEAKNDAVAWFVSLFYVGAATASKVIEAKPIEPDVMKEIITFSINAAGILVGAFVTGFVTHIGTIMAKAAVERFKNRNNPKNGNDATK
jgi:hypothetical protein